MRYILEIYGPDVDADTWISFESDAPFGAMSAGDLIRPQAFDEKPPMGAAIRITRIEHIVRNESQGLSHKICVYTTAIEGSFPVVA
jgi:hypothetical protein